LPANPHYAYSVFTSTEDSTVTSTLHWNKSLPIACLLILLGACASTPKVTTVQHLSPEADAPYSKILVIALLDSYDSRKYLEKETVQQLVDLGIEAVASTTMMDSRTPVVRQTFVDMVVKIGADAVIVTQLQDVEITAKVKDMRPEATYNIRPTYYYNVWSVDLTEYVAPPAVQLDADLALATQLLSIATEKTVWSMESHVNVVRKAESYWEYSIYVDQAVAIANTLSRDGLIDP
jgi:hypothetical protein